jgi:SAM-dependent methyltransferase
VAFTKYETRGAYHWDEIAHLLPNRYSARLRAQYKWFVDEARKRNPGLIVDVGCGDAALTHLVANATRARVVGIEPEPRGLELARSALAHAGSSAEVLAGSGEALPFEDGEVSLVLMSEVIEHVPDAGALIREAARVLCPSGTLLMSTPQWQTEVLREHHVHEYKSDELWELCARSFNDVDVLAAESPRIYRRYLSSRSWRVAINVASLLGWNAFCRRVPAKADHADWRQLFAIASEPR